VADSRIAPWHLLPVREPDLDLTHAAEPDLDLTHVAESDPDLTHPEAEDEIRQQALATLRELSESWWSGERRHFD